jgi:metal-responsive CopG/Arc/MetJ family transcriptional regulator
MIQRTVKRGAYRKTDYAFIGAWIPVELLGLMDDFIRTQDSDRSKLIRRALEEKLRNGKKEPA